MIYIYIYIYIYTTEQINQTKLLDILSTIICWVYFSLKTFLADDSVLIWVVIHKRLKLYLPRQMNNEWNVNFLQNGSLGIRHTFQWVFYWSKHFWNSSFDRLNFPVIFMMNVIAWGLSIKSWKEFEYSIESVTASYYKKEILKKCLIPII